MPSLLQCFYPSILSKVAFILKVTPIVRNGCRSSSHHIHISDRKKENVGWGRRQKGTSRRFSKSPSDGFCFNLIGHPIAKKIEKKEFLAKQELPLKI